MYYLDLFSGIGGFALGAYWAGWRFDKHYFSEVEKYSIERYYERFPGAISLGDIEKINFKILPKGEWIVAGGFPCTDISVANRVKGGARGIEGEKSGLWKEYKRCISELRPKYAIVENVPAIFNRGMGTILGDLVDIGYDAQWDCISAWQIGMQNARKRLFLVAYPDNLGLEKVEIFRCSDFKSEISQEGKRIKIKHDEQYLFDKIFGYRLPIYPGDIRMADGIPEIVDRIKCIGNSVVPQIAEILFRRIKEIEYGRIQ